MIDYLDFIKEHDLIINGNLYLTTGNASILENRHGLVVETCIKYNDMNSDADPDCEFENYIQIPMSVITKKTDHPKKVNRPKGFSFVDLHPKNAELEYYSRLFEERFKTILDSKEMSIFDVEGGITIGGNEGSLFDLQDPKEVKKNETELVKRICMGTEVLRDLIKNKRYSDNFFKIIDQEMQYNGCKYYTFKRPDSGNYIRRLENKKTAELRIVGYIR